MSLNRYIHTLFAATHYAAVYALKPPYYNTCADINKRGGGIFERGGGGGSPPSPSPLYESLRLVSTTTKNEGGLIA